MSVEAPEPVFCEPQDVANSANTAAPTSAAHVRLIGTRARYLSAMRGQAHTMFGMRMVDVTAKDRTVRAAAAAGYVQTTIHVVDAIKLGAISKGDVLAAARLAAVIAVKKTPDLVPLCHPIAIGAVEVDVDADSDRVSIAVRVKTRDRTGVEMEALTAVCAAGLTVVDMVKGLDPDASIERVRVLAKTGGKTGNWERAQGR